MSAADYRLVLSDAAVDNYAAVAVASVDAVAAAV